MQTSYSDVLTHLISRSPVAKLRLKAWSESEQYKDVVPFVQEHLTSFLYDLTVEEVKDACYETEHALGEVKRSVAESVLLIRDWHTPFAFIHMFHYALEHYRSVPTYQAFHTLLTEDQFMRTHLLEPAKTAIAEAILLGCPTRTARDAMRWRIGNAYYSFLRELYTMTQLRHMGHDILYHPLADALLAVDCWTGDQLISLYIGNAAYKVNHRLGCPDGRKARAQQILGDAEPPFSFNDIQLETASKFGVVHLPSMSELADVAESLAEHCNVRV